MNGLATIARMNDEQVERERMFARMRKAGRLAPLRSQRMARYRSRLECLRGKLRAERISYDELHELQSLAPFIEAGDVELLEAAGVTDPTAQNWK